MGLLRLLLALAVVIWHSQPILGQTLIGGPNAVDIFFVISGFYMALILSEKYKHGKNSFRTFLGNRFLKIFPAYWVTLLVSILVGVLGIIFFRNYSLFEPYLENAGKMNLLTLVYLLAANILIFGQDLMLFLGFNTSSHSLYLTKNYATSNLLVTNFFPIGQAWSIALELVFYLMAPFLTKVKSRYLISLIVMSLAGRLLMYKMGYEFDPWNYRFFPLEIMFFLLGILAYRFYKKIKSWENIGYYSWTAFFMVIITLVWYPHTYVGLSMEARRWIYYAMTIPLLPFVFVAFKDIKIDRKIGELSYPLYLSHNIFVYVILELFRYRGGNTGIYVVASSLAFSYFLIKFLINPIDKIRQARIAAS